jgi:hypothetical protein
MKIMLIRHAEKPNQSSGIMGVTISGIPSKDELSVVGWQRAGALVRFFAPIDGHPAKSLVSEPATIFASASVPGSESLRPQHTVSPLANAIGLRLITTFAEGQEAAMVEAALLEEGQILISWHHEAIPRIVKAFGCAASPQTWDPSRFDLVWVLIRTNPGDEWKFSQVPQMLLAGDQSSPIPAQQS